MLAFVLVELLKQLLLVLTFLSKLLNLPLLLGGTRLREARGQVALGNLGRSADTAAVTLCADRLFGTRPCLDPEGR